MSTQKFPPSPENGSMQIAAALTRITSPADTRSVSSPLTVRSPPLMATVIERIVIAGAIVPTPLAGGQPRAEPAVPESSGAVIPGESMENAVNMTRARTPICISLPFFRIVYLNKIIFFETVRLPAVSR
jgi:hypothetical protein